MAVAVHHGRDLWNFAREDTDPIHVPRPEGPWGPWALHGAQCQQPVQNAPLQTAVQAAAPKPTIQTTVQSPTTQEAAPIVLWERPPKPAGWSAIWEVLPPPPPPPFGQDGVWIWVPEGEEAPVGGMVPHEGAFLPCADIDDELEASYASQSPSQGFASVSMQAAFAEMPLGPAPGARSDYSSGGTSAGGQEKTQIVQIPSAVPPVSSEQTPVSRKGELPSSNFTDAFHSQASAGMSGMRGFADAKDAFAASAATRGNEDASSMKSPSVQSNPYLSLPGVVQDASSMKSPSVQSNPYLSLPGVVQDASSMKSPSVQSNPYLSLPGVVQASMRDSPPASQAQVPQVWNPFPTETIAAEPPVEQAWNPWASMGEVDGPFGRSLQETQRMIVGDIGAFNSDDWRSRSALPSMQSVPAPSSNSLQATAFPAGATAAGLPSMPSMPFGSGVAGAQLSPIGMEDFHSLESTSFWKVQPAAAPLSQNGSVQVPTPRPNSINGLNVMTQVPQLGISSQGSIPPGRKSIPSAGSGSQAFLTSTSDGLEVTYPMNQLAPLSSQRLSQNARPLPHPTEVPGAAHLASPASPTPWPMACSAGLRPTPQVQLLDVTGAGSCLRNQMDIPGRPDYDVLGPMHPMHPMHPAPASCGANATWMNDPRLAQMPVAQIAERNRHAAPVLLDVTSGGQAFHPDD